MTNTDAFLAELSKSQYGWPASLRFTYDTTRRLLEQGIQGNLVECGVANGVHPAAMARACQDAGESRAVRLFDSFEGLPHGGPNDRDWQEGWPELSDGTGRLQATGVTACSLENVRANLARWDLDGYPFVFHQGWFQDTVPELAATATEPIAFLRLDGDLYESTLVCLRELYPLVASGGTVVLDDWNLDGCRQAFADYFGAAIASGAGVHALDPRLPVVRPITESGDVYWVKP